jgi:hypothetical protein
MKAITHLLNYCATHPNATLRYVASDMMLHVESDASYLSETKGRSRAAGIHFLTQRPATTGNIINVSPPPNGALYVHCHILTEVLSSAAEAELAALFHNGKEACAIRTLLQELGHPITLFCQTALVALLQEGSALGQVVDRLDPPDLVPGSRWVPLMSLTPLLLPDPQQIPYAGGYLRPDPQRVAAWGERLQRRPHRRLIALHWQGNPGHEGSLYSRGRSMAFGD